MISSPSPLQTAPARRPEELDSEIEALKFTLQIAEMKLMGLYIEGIEAYGEPYTEELFDSWKPFVDAAPGSEADRANPALRLKTLDAIYTYAKLVAAIEFEEY